MTLTIIPFTIEMSSTKEMASPNIHYEVLHDLENLYSISLRDFALMKNCINILKNISGDYITFDTLSIANGLIL